MQRKRQETFLVKFIYVVAFLVSASGTFLATDDFSVWVKSKSEMLSMLPVQLILASLPMYLISIIEGRVMWRFFQEDGFSSIFPVTTGVTVGYLLHYYI